MAFDSKNMKQETIIRIDPRISNLSSKDKMKLIDSIANSNGLKGLIIDFPFSHTGRRINRRVYSKVGHKRVAEELVNGYPKPITVDHEGSATTTIGRIIAAEYKDTLDEASAFFRKNRINEKYLHQMNESLQTLDYEKIADSFHSSKVLLNRDWKGIGKIAAKGKITDPEAIIKFIDERYLTLSAEQDTDVYICSICFSDWKQSGICEHTPGSSYDNKLAFIMCGHMAGNGSSVVLHPADPDSIVTSMSLSDEEENMIDVVSRSLDITLFDSEINIIEEKPMNLFQLFLNGEALDKENSYSLYEEIFKNLDSKVTKEDFNKIPNSCFVNNVLPIIDEAHAISLKEFIKDFTVLDNQILIMDSLNEKLNIFVSDTGQDSVSSRKEDFLRNIKDSEFIKSIDASLIKDTIKGIAETLDLIHDNSEKISELEQKATSLTDSLAEKTNLVSREQEKFRLLNIEYKNLVKDHIAVVNKLEDSLNQFNILLDKVIPVTDMLVPENKLTDKSVKNIIGLLDSVDIVAMSAKLNDGLTKTVVKIEDSPVVDSTKLHDNKNITEYEVKVAKKYQELLKSKGKASAELYFARNKQFCSKTFDPTKN